MAILKHVFIALLLCFFGGGLHAELSSPSVFKIFPPKTDSIEPLQVVYYGSPLRIELGNHYYWEKIGNEECEGVRLSIEEAYPFVLFYKELVLSEPAFPHHSGEMPKILCSSDINTIEYYTRSGVLAKRIRLDEINPYLVASDGASIFRNVFDAEALTYDEAYNPSDNVNANLHFVNQYVGNQNGYTTVNFWLTSATESGYIKKNETTLLVLDTLGNEIFRQRMDGFASIPVLDHSTKFLLAALLPVETTSHAGLKYHADGFEIWDIENKRLLHKEINDNPEMVVAEPSVGFASENPGFIGVGFTVPSSSNTLRIHYIFDCNIELLYSYSTTIIDIQRSMAYIQKHGKREKSVVDFLQDPSTIQIPLNYGK